MTNSINFNRLDYVLFKSERPEHLFLVVRIVAGMSEEEFVELMHILDSTNTYSLENAVYSYDFWGHFQKVDLESTTDTTNLLIRRLLFENGVDKQTAALVTTGIYINPTEADRLATSVFEDPKEIVDDLLKKKDSIKFTI